MVEELLLKFFPAAYFGKPAACKSKDGYLFAMLLERLKVADDNKFFKDFNSRLFCETILSQKIYVLGK